MCYIVPNFTLVLFYQAENRILLIGRFFGKPIDNNLQKVKTIAMNFKKH